MRKMYITKGLPACGKTTWAEYKVLADRDDGIQTKNVCKDDIREMLDFSHWSRLNEKVVLRVRDAIIHECLTSMCNVIVSDTNLAPAHEKKLREIAKHHGVQVEIVDFTDVPVSECLERDRKRGNKVGAEVILKMYNQYLKKEVNIVSERDESLMDAVIVDVDGTLAHRGERSPYDGSRVMEDTVNEPIADLARLFFEQGYKIIIMTGRENTVVDNDGTTVQDLTIEWLNKNNIRFHDIHIRANGDHRSDYEVKKELFVNNVKGLYNIKWVLDDRAQVVQAWRELGLTVLDVAGNTF